MNVKNRRYVEKINQTNPFFVSSCSCETFVDLCKHGGLSEINCAYCIVQLYSGNNDYGIVSFVVRDGYNKVP